MLTDPHTRRARRKAWIAMFVTSLLVAALTFVVFGLLGGFMLMVGLNGMSERQAQPVFLVYFALVLGGCALVTTLINWLILRGLPAAGLRARAALVPAAVASAGLLFIGPVIVILIIRALG